MDFNIIRHIFRFIILIALQVVILNHIYLGGFITPFIYPLFILLLPFSVNGSVLLLSAFALGLSVDMFSDSLGLHTAATTIMAFMRPTIIRIISGKTDFDPGTEPNPVNNGVVWTMLYSMILILIHHTALFFIEAFRTDAFLQIIIRSVVSTIFSTVVIMIIYLLISKRSRASR